MDDDRPTAPTVERVEKPDGRYILYFSWPGEPAEGEAPADPRSDADE
jgi:hypothetical protein